MNILADENVARIIVDRLRAEIIIRLIQEYNTDLLDAFTVVTAKTVRVRRNPLK